MRFGISATSWIFPKNLRTRLRPVNVCAISSLLALSNRRVGTTLRKAAIHRGRQDRRRAPLFLCDSVAPEPPAFSAGLAEILQIGRASCRERGEICVRVGG